MLRTIRQLCCLHFTVAFAAAQTPGASPVPPPANALPQPPKLSVGVLVDVSGSISAKMANEGLKIILDIVSGRGYRPPSAEWKSNFEEPETEANYRQHYPTNIDVWPPPDPVLTEMFEPYWKGGTGQLEPLTESGKYYDFARFGEIETTLTAPQSGRIRSVLEFENTLKGLFPKNSQNEFKDKSTDYYIAVALASERLLTDPEVGCYLFVVSDEWDDPDVRGEITKEESNTMESAGIARDAQLGFQPQKVKEFTRLKDNDKFHLIARFHSGVRRRIPNKDYIRLAWYGIGAKPEPVRPPVVVKVEGQPALEPPKPPQPPAFGRRLTLLGGLFEDETKPDDSRFKKFDHPYPFIAWQVDGVTISSAKEESQFESVLYALKDGDTPQLVHRRQPEKLKITGFVRGYFAGSDREPLPDGKYRVTITEKTGDAPGSLPLSATTWFEVRTPFNWVPWLLGFSVLGAAGVIGYSVWTLRR